MPLVSIEYTSNLGDVEFLKVCPGIHDVLVKKCDANMSSCKAIITKLSNYCVGDGRGKANAFILLKIGLTPGRSNEQLSTASEEILSIVDKYIIDTGLNVGVGIQTRLQFYELSNYFFGKTHDAELPKKHKLGFHRTKL